jgi:dephospho-CoA kinase
MSKIIALHGFAQVGKDTVAGLLGEYGYIRRAFADKLRDALYILNPIILADSYGRIFRLQEIVDEIGWDEAKVNHPEVRRLMQVLGTEVGRELLGPDVWVDLLTKQLEYGKKYVITDLRFLNEVTALRRLPNVTLVRVTRPGVGPVNGHVSDKGLDIVFDEEILNDGTLDDLHGQVLEIAKS